MLLLRSFCVNLRSRTLCIGDEREKLARAFVFINAEPRREVEVLQTLRKTKYVKEPLMLYGGYDLARMH